MHGADNCAAVARDFDRHRATRETSVLTADRRRFNGDGQARLRAALPLTQRARLAELEHAGWSLGCIRTVPPQVIVVSPKGRAAVLTAEGRLADPMGVTLRHR